jgi:hypothetical protein
MKSNKNQSEEEQNKEVYPNLSEKELERDLINLHLPEVDLVGDEDRSEYLKKLYGDDYLDGLDLTDEDEDEEE